MPSPSPESFREAAHLAVDLLADYLAMLTAGPVHRSVPAEHRERILTMELPATGMSPSELVDEILRDVMAYPMGNNHPNFFGWVNSPALPSSILGAFLSAGMNPSVAGGDHAGVYVEHLVLRWLGEMLGLDSGTTGVLTSGGSSANLVGLAVARNELLARLNWDTRAAGLRASPPITVYATEEAHSSLLKAIELLGIGHQAVRTVPLDDNYRLDAAALSAIVDRDRPEAGIICASAGTVNSGAVDPLNAIAEIAKRNKLWLHVDGAYGAVARIVDDVAHLLRGLEQADSISVDPHKWLYVAIDCGCVFVRDREAMRRTFSLVPPYLRDASATLPWFSEFTFEQTRPFRALKLWSALRERGLDWYRASLARDVALARQLAEAIRDSQDFQLCAPVDLSIVAFRALPAALAGDTDAIDRVNRELPLKIQRDGRMFLTGSTMAGRPILRTCFVNYATDQNAPAHILQVIRDLVS